MAESGRFRVEVVSPERVLFSGDAKQVITRTLDGSHEKRSQMSRRDHSLTVSTSDASRTTRCVTAFA